MGQFPNDRPGASLQISVRQARAYRDSTHRLSRTVFFRRGRDGNKKYLSVVARRARDPSTEGTFSCSTLPFAPLSPCSRCYHCRLFCGLRIICAFPRLYSCGSPFYRIIKSLSADCLLVPRALRPSFGTQYVAASCLHGATRGAFLVYRGMREDGDGGREKSEG